MTASAPALNMPELEARILPGLEQVEELLLANVQGASGLVDELTAHLALAGGKRMRPALTLLCAQLGDPTGQREINVVKAAACMEMTHLATLYHDDVMDSAPRRRGAEAAQEIWGNNRAILAGDVLFARASQLMADLGSKAVRDHAHTFERLCLGQLNETFGPRAEDDPVDFYLQVLADKTGSLLASSASLGATIGGASEKVGQIVAQYGECMGVAFQIADDILDLAVAGEVSGKTPGTDLREGVDTLPVLLLRRQGTQGDLDTAGQEILRRLDHDDLADDDALATVVDLLRAHPVVAETRALARSWAEDAVAHLAQLPVEAAEVREGLTAFAWLAVDRPS